jgi:hypothetical protein
MNDICTLACSQLLLRLVPISVFAREFLNREGVSVLFTFIHSKASFRNLKYIIATILALEVHHHQQFISSLESMQWREISAAVEALLQRIKASSHDNRNQPDLLSDIVRLLSVFSSVPFSFHFRIMSFMLSSQAIEIVLRFAIIRHDSPASEPRASALAALRFVLALMDFDLSIKPVCDLKPSLSKSSSATAGGFALDSDEYQSAAALTDVAPLLPDLLGLLASSIKSVMSNSPCTTQAHKVSDASQLSIEDYDQHREIIFCILKVLTFLVDNPLAADVIGAAGGIELLVKLIIFGEEGNKADALSILRMLHSRNHLNRQILARLTGSWSSCNPFIVSNLTHFSRQNAERSETVDQAAAQGSPTLAQITFKNRDHCSSRAFCLQRGYRFICLVLQPCMQFAFRYSKRRSASWLSHASFCSRIASAFKSIHRTKSGILYSACSAFNGTTVQDF